MGAAAEPVHNSLHAQEQRTAQELLSFSLLFPQIAASPSPARASARQAGSWRLPAFPLLPLPEDDGRKRADNAH